MTVAIILGVVFCALAIAAFAYGLFALGVIPPIRKASGAGQNVGADANRVKGIVSMIVGGVFAVLFVFVPFSFHTVDTGEVAVVKHMGEATKVRTSGTYFDFWVTESYFVYDAKVQDLSISTQAYSQDAQTMDIDLTVQYQISTTNVLDIAGTYGSLDVLNSRIESVAVDAMKTVMAENTAENIIQNRGEIAKSVTDRIISRIDSSYYVSVQTAVLTDISFTDAYEAAVEAQMIAEREKEAAIIKAEQQLEVAKREAEARLEQAQGEANAQKALAEAEAYSASIKIVELARTLGYEVTQTSAEDSVSFDIEWGTDDSGKALLLDYLKYLEYLATWDGKLPGVVGDGTGIMITIPSTSDDSAQSTVNQ